MVREALNKTSEIYDAILSMVIEIGSLSEAWRIMEKMAAETNDAATYRVKRGLEGLNKLVK